MSGAGATTYDLVCNRGALQVGPFRILCGVDSESSNDVISADARRQRPSLWHPSARTIRARSANTLGTSTDHQPDRAHTEEHERARLRNLTRRT